MRMRTGIWRGLVLIAAVWGGLATAQTTNVVARSDLRLRANPSASARAVSSVPEGYPVMLGACNRGWCEVRYMGVRGFVREDQLRRVSVPVRTRTLPPPRPAPTEEADSAPTLRIPDRPGPVRPLCKGKYDDAEAYFALGAYAETIGLIAVCASDATFTPEEAIGSYRMLALSHFYEGDQRATREALLELLERDPDYVPSDALDPDGYVALVRGLKLELEIITPTDFRCDRRAEEAEPLYVAGDFESVHDLLTECLAEDRLAESIAIRTHRLAALAYMKREQRDEAREVLRSLLDAVPDYEADPVQDLPGYVALVKDVRGTAPVRRTPWGW